MFRLAPYKPHFHYAILFATGLDFSQKKDLIHGTKEAHLPIHNHSRVSFPQELSPCSGRTIKQWKHAKEKEPR